MFGGGTAIYNIPHYSLKIKYFLYTGLCRLPTGKICTAGNTAVSSYRVHEGAQHSEDLCSAAALHCVAAERVYSHESEPARNESGCAALYICFCSFRHGGISFLKVYASILCKNPANIRKPPPGIPEKAAVSLRKIVPEYKKAANISHKSAVFVLVA